MERVLFLKEQDERLYSVSAYFLAKTVAEIPIQIISLLVYFVAGYFGIGLNSSSPSHFFVFCTSHTGLALFLHNFSSNSLALFMGALISNVHVILSISPVPATQLLIILFLVFSGFFSSLESIPAAFRWISYLSVSRMQPYRFVFQAIYINEFTDLQMGCELQQAAVRCQPLDLFPHGETMWYSILALGLMALGYRVLGLIALTVRVKSLGN